MPLFTAAGKWLPWLRRFQSGQTTRDVLYVLLMLIALLGWGALGGEP